MVSRWRKTSRTAPAGDAWITREFTVRGLSPPDCTPEALARALERERQITIEFRPHASDDPGVYGLLYRREGAAQTSVILFRPTYSIALRRLTVFHELAHILFDHALTEVADVGLLRGYMVSDEDDAVAEAFAVGAMQYSFLEVAPAPVPPDATATGMASTFGHFLQRTQYRL